MAIEIDGITYRTERQWEKMHRHIRKGSVGKGVQREWYSPYGKESGVFYRESQTHPWSKAEKSAEKRAKAAARRAAEDDALAERAREAAREEQLRMHIRKATGCPKQGEVACTHWGATSDIIKFASCEHTAFQWVNAGFVPRDDARWRMSNDYNTFYYCEWYDVRWNPERASELMETAPREVDRLPDGNPYNGKSWW